jgi:hypothetical protein
MPSGFPPRLELAAQALSAVGAVDAGTAQQIWGEFDVASTIRLLSLLNEAGAGPGGLSPDVRARLEELRQFRLARAADRMSYVSGVGAGQAGSRQATRVVPVGRVIPGDGVCGDLVLLAYLQGPGGARFAAAVGTAGSPGRRGPALERGIPPQPPQLTAADDRGTSYQPIFTGNHGQGVLELRPAPPRQIRWLDLTTAPGEPAIRIDLGPPDRQLPAPDVTVTGKAHSPGELLLDVIAARILSIAARVRHDDPEQLAAARRGLRLHIAKGLGDLVAALQAADVLPAASPVPGQLAGLCTRLGVSGHGITAPPAAALPEPWESMLTRFHRPALPEPWESMLTRHHRRQPYQTPAPGSWAAPMAELPELDGTSITILGLHHGDLGLTFLNTLVSGVTSENDWIFTRVVRPLPVLWIRDDSGRWHTTGPYGIAHPVVNGEAMVWLQIWPPLDRGTTWIDVVATGQSAQARATLPLRWR